MKWGTSESAGEHRRRTFRFTASEPSDAFLSIQGRDVPVRIRDESAGGFGVVVEEPLADQGDVGVLRTASATVEVRVANVSKESLVSGGRGDVGYRLGLQRLRDLPLAPCPPERVGWLKRLFPAGLCGPGVSPAAPVAVVATLVAMVVAAILWSYHTGHLPLWTAEWRPASADRKCVPAALDRTADRAAGVMATVSDTLKSSDAPTRRASSAGVGVVVNEGVDAIRASIRRLPGPSALLLPETGRTLGLTDSQRAQIRTLNDTVTEAIERLETKLPSVSRLERNHKRSVLLDEARRQSLLVLTPEQRQQWDSLQ